MRLRTLMTVRRQTDPLPLSNIQQHYRWITNGALPVFPAGCGGYGDSFCAIRLTATQLLDVVEGVLQAGL